jgi:hypothetical protein
MPSCGGMLVLFSLAEKIYAAVAGGSASTELIACASREARYFLAMSWSRNRRAMRASAFS